MSKGKGWVSAIDLATGDQLVSLKGDRLSVVGNERYEASMLMYNLEVVGFHTYAVADEQVWVHNKCGKEGGVYIHSTKDSSYVGQSVDMAKRKTSHMGKGASNKSALKGKDITDSKYHSMPGSTKWERDVAEQYLLRGKGGVDGTLNRKNVIGPKRMEQYNKDLSKVKEKYGL